MIIQNIFASFKNFPQLQIPDDVIRSTLWNAIKKCAQLNVENSHVNGFIDSSME